MTLTLQTTRLLDGWTRQDQGFAVRFPPPRQNPGSQNQKNVKRTTVDNGSLVGVRYFVVRRIYCYYLLLYDNITTTVPFILLYNLKRDYEYFNVNS
jgi:hypothetical protein